ncbi:MauE/DoxX family redox-associated membrane protein [Lysinibacillus sphaericus]|uniref:MauE/DoxX family redox-associated membrane protein n=1 Tax=Lysinibacillus sphaericus TaxID=1421 RepID=UPI003F7936FD
MINYTINIILGSLFLLAFYAKIINIKDFNLEIIDYKVVPRRLAPIAAVCVLSLELGLFFSFTLSKYYFLSNSVAICLLTLFTIFTYLKNQSKKDNSLKTCTCFGNVKFLNKYPIQRNLFLIIVIIVNHSLFSTVQIKIQTRLVIMLSILFIFLIFICIHLVNKKRTRNIVIDFLANQKLNNGLAIFLDYRSDSFSEIDSILSMNKQDSIVVFLSGPTWLVKGKEKKWNTSVISVDCDFISEDFISIIKGKSIQTYNNVSLYLKYN